MLHLAPGNNIESKIKFQRKKSSFPSPSTRSSFQLAHLWKLVPFQMSGTHKLESKGNPVLDFGSNYRIRKHQPLGGLAAVGQLIKYAFNPMARGRMPQLFSFHFLLFKDFLSRKLDFQNVWREFFLFAVKPSSSWECKLKSKLKFNKKRRIFQMFV